MKANFALVFSFVFFSFSSNAHELDKVIEYTIKNNAKIKSAEYKYLEEQEKYMEIFSSFLPNISMSLNYDLNETDLTIKPKVSQFTISQPIFNFGSSLVGYEKSRNLIKISKNSLLQTKKDVILETVQAYMSVVEQEAKNSLYKYTIDTIRQHLDAEKKLFELGETTKISLEKVKTELSTVISEKTKIEGDLNNSYVRYINITEMNPKSLKAPKGIKYKIASSLQESIDLALNNSLQRKSSKLLYQSNKDSLNEAYLKLFPSFSLNLSLSRNRTNGNGNEETKDSKSAMITTSIPLFHSGIDYFKIKQLKYSLEKSREDLYENKKNVEEAVTIAWNNVNTVRSYLKSSEEKVESYNVVLDSAREARKLNTGTILDVIDAENDLLTAKKELAVAEAKHIVALYTLLLQTSNLEDLL